MLNKKEINKLIGRVHREGYTLIPTKLYFKKGKLKWRLQLQKGKNNMTKDKSKKEGTGIEKKQDILENLAN